MYYWGVLQAQFSTVLWSFPIRAGTSRMLAKGPLSLSQACVICVNTWQVLFPQESNQQLHFQGFLDARVSVQDPSVLGAGGIVYSQL